jgi:ABC-type microcin C transport system permease subunit YejE
MPQSRKRKGHPYKKPADIPAKQRVKGRTIWSLLLAAFGVIIALFATDLNYAVMIIGAIIGATVGYYIGKKMEQEMAEK